MTILRAWLLAFTFTQLVEVPLYVRLLGVAPLRAFGASALTHPLVWFVLVPRLPFVYLANAALAELFAIGVEALYFARSFGPKRAVSASLVANLASVTLGLTSRALLGAP